MKSTLRIISTCACALALATTLASCMKTMPPGNNNPDPKFPGGAPITVTDLTTSATLPAEPPPYDGSISREEYARFAWRQFIYLNSPVQRIYDPSPPAGMIAVVRGTISADPEYTFLDSGSPDFYETGTRKFGGPFPLGRNHLIWETFAHRSELFPANAPPKGDLKSLSPQYNFANVTVGRVSDMIRFNNLDENTQISQNQIFFPKNGSTPSANPYDDHMIFFEAKVNQAEHDYIKKTLGNTYPEEADVHNAIPRIEFPPNVGSPVPAGAQSADESIEVKAAWREMTDELIKSRRYHTAEATYYVNGGNGPEPRVGTFGLVGLHILRKMKNYPAFIYTTFEHVDNLQKPDKSPTGLYVVTLYDTMNYKPPITKPVQAMVNTGAGHFQSVALPLEGQVNAANGYPIIDGSFQVRPPLAGPITVEPSQAMTIAVNNVNAEVLQAMGKDDEFEKTVWPYYRLAGIQIVPVNENSVTSTGEPDPLTEDFYLANTVIESSRSGVQLFKGAVADPGLRGAAPNQLINDRSKPNVRQVRGLDPSTYDTVVMGGCMGCHGNAQYPRDPNNNELGPTIFNFLTSEDTLSGKGFGVDVRPERLGEPRTNTHAYIE
ncbi:hypothetical protein D7X74_07460 [Corallococcus sp. CA047B]|uniref:hypothetical protein n=1 Tax=Corallococcus sp. CA047B TaxID=2316729 RepID=UPI000EA06853|nr:hypothetical protein [Corallococcus sp. CA047B]RKH19246.1 hypothetical protein D7X74_07460 [Corallococcus sp. CA047B]